MNTVNGPMHHKFLLSMVILRFALRFLAGASFVKSDHRGHTLCVRITEYNGPKSLKKPLLRQKDDNIPQVIQSLVDIDLYTYLGIYRYG